MANSLERSRVVGYSDEDLDELVCGICLTVLCEPLVVQCCRQTYCKRCIEEWLNDHTSCPNDRIRLTREGLVQPPRMLCNLLSNIRVKCDNHSLGCTAILKPSQLDEHATLCQFNKCQVCGANAKVEHDCLDNLKTKNKSLADEIDELTRKINKMKIDVPSQKQCQSRSPKSRLDILLSARNNVHNFHLEHYNYSGNVPYVSKGEENILVEVCKDALLDTDTFVCMANRISEQLVDRMSRDPGESWHVLVFSVDHGETVVLGDKYFRIRFDSLVVEVFATRKKQNKSLENMILEAVGSEYNLIDSGERDDELLDRLVEEAKKLLANSDFSTHNHNHNEHYRYYFCNLAWDLCAKLKDIRPDDFSGALIGIDGNCDINWNNKELSREYYVFALGDIYFSIFFWH